MALIKITNPKLKEELISHMQDYACSYFNDYAAELGWADWMDQYVEGSEDGYEPSEAEIDRINDFLWECWQEAHAEVTEQTFIKAYDGNMWQKVWEMAEQNGPGYIEYEGERYALLAQATPGENNTYTAPAVKLGDKIDTDYNYTCPRYEVEWNINDGFDPERDFESDACDWDHPVEVRKNGDYRFNHTNFR